MDLATLLPLAAIVLVGMALALSQFCMVRAVLGLAKALEIEVVAEGVETEAQRDFLLAEACSQQQGYLFAKPMPAEALGSRLKTWP